MRIGCLQFSPQVGDVSNNLNRADAVLSKADPMELDNLDLLVLPEMAFSGYNFKSLEHIMQYLEPSGSGISALWARTTALKHDCIVAVGYPEKVDSSRRHRNSGPKYYNSLIVVNGDGETLANYRKSFLYYTDATWAQEGGGFFGGKIDGLGQIAMGICMDINPYKFEAPWDAYEFGVHVMEVKANLVILSMAWLTLEDRSTFTPFPKDPDMDTISYWVQRLEPLIRSDTEDEIIVIFCNRCGIEDDAVYAGTSAVVGVKHGEVSVYGLLGRGVKELLVVNTDLPPFANLVSRSNITEVRERAPPSMPPSPPQVSPSQISSGKPSPKERLGDLPEAEEPQSPTDIPTTSANQVSAPLDPDTVVESPQMTQISPSPWRSSWSESQASKEQHSEGTTGPSQLGGVSGLGIQHPHGPNGPSESNSGGMSEILEPLVYTPNPIPIPALAPAPALARPKLAISTGTPKETSSGNLISRHFSTPPMSAIDEVVTTPLDTLHAPTHYPWTTPPTNLITPDEPTWPVDVPTNSYSKRTSTRSQIHMPEPQSKRLSRSEMTERSPGTERMWSPSSPQSNIDTQSRLASHTDISALKAAVREAGLSNQADAPPRPASPKTKNASRDSSREASRASSRAPSRDASRSRSKNPSRAASRCASRSPARDASNNPSRASSRHPSRAPSREPSRPREDPTIISPTSHRRSLHSDIGQALDRARSGRARSSSPARKAQHKVSDSSEGHRAAKNLLSSFKESIPIVVDPNIYKNSLREGETSVEPQAVPRPGHSRGRSKSTSNIAPFQRHPTRAQDNHRMTADFSSVWSTRGRTEMRNETSRQEPSTGPNRGRGRGHEGARWPDTQHDTGHTNAKMTARHSIDTLHPGLQALLAADEAFLGRTLARAETWREKREGRRTQPGSRERAPLPNTKPVERIQPTFFF